MTTYNRNILIAGIVIFSSVILLFIWLKGCHATDGNYTIQKPDTLHWANKAGDSVMSLKGQDIDFTIIEKRVIDSVAKVYDTKVKNLQQLIIVQTRTITELQATGPAEIDFTPDTSHPECPPVVRNMRQTFSSPYYRAMVQVGDSSYLHLIGRDTITSLWKRVREGNIFNRKHFIQFDISNANPDTKITGLLAYKVPEKKQKKFGIGISGGCTYDGKFKPYIGMGVNYNLIRF